MKRIQVVAAIIYSKDRSTILIAKRPADKHQGNLWEFPGGKKEPSESNRQALLRELQEELGITVQNCQPALQLEYDYPDKLVSLDIWEVTHFSGTATGQEGQAISWVAIDQLHHYAFPAANGPIVEWLRSTAKTRTQLLAKSQYD